jgi:hypothetical protein
MLVVALAVCSWGQEACASSFTDPNGSEVSRSVAKCKLDRGAGQGSVRPLVPRFAVRVTATPQTLAHLATRVSDGIRGPCASGRRPPWLRSGPERPRAHGARPRASHGARPTGTRPRGPKGSHEHSRRYAQHPDQSVTVCLLTASVTVNHCDAMACQSAKPSAMCSRRASPAGAAVASAVPTCSLHCTAPRAQDPLVTQSGAV